MVKKCFSPSPVDSMLLGNKIGIFRSITTKSAYAQAVGVTAWTQDYDQLQKGEFSGKIEEVWLENVQFYSETSSLALHKTCQSWPGSIYFNLSKPTFKPGYINNQLFHSGDILVQKGGTFFEMITPPDFQSIGLVVDKIIFNDYIQALSPSFNLDDFLTSQVWRQPLAISHHNWHFYFSSLNQIKLIYQNSDDSSLQINEYCDTLQHQLVEQLTSILLYHSYSKETKNDTALRYRKTVSKIYQFILDHPTERLSISLFCEKFNVSRRTLQNIFNDTLNISPNCFIKRIRLNQFRKALIEDTEHICLQDIAAQHGFWHPSQLATDYRQLFGELPSKTVQ